MTPMNNLNEPVLPGTAETDYERYLRTDELLGLQKTAGEVVHRDEHLFQAVHQTSELWLKLACTELDAAAALVDEDRPAHAVRLLRRSNDALALVTTQLHMLEHMSPADYAIVRTALGHGEVHAPAGTTLAPRRRGRAPGGLLNAWFWVWNEGRVLAVLRHRRTKVVDRFPGETGCLGPGRAVLDPVVASARGLGLTDRERPDKRR